MSGTIGNADSWTAVFRNALGAATDPDGNVTWVVTIPDRIVATTTQTLGQKTATGTFVLVYTPTETAAYSVKASAVVGGIAQSTPATLREVVA